MSVDCANESISSSARIGLTGTSSGSHSPSRNLLEGLGGGVGGVGALVGDMVGDKVSRHFDLHGPIQLALFKLHQGALDVHFEDSVSVRA